VFSVCLVTSDYLRKAASDFARALSGTVYRHPARGIRDKMKKTKLVAPKSRQSIFEHRRQPVISRPLFIRRMGRFVGMALLLVGMSWLIGILGYRFLENLSWVDSILNAAMILGGMGPVNPLQTNAGKLFASFYALFSGIVFLVSVGLLVAPIIHRVLHQFHVDTDIEQ
jgi:hypothetical protein